MKQHKVVTLDDIRSGKITLPLASSDDQKCEDHEDEIKKFYCETCQKPVCRDCIVMKQHCRDHECITLKEAAKIQAARLVQLAQQGEQLKKIFQEAIQKNEEVKEKFERSFQKSNKKAEAIKETFTKKVEYVFEKHKSNSLKLKSKRGTELDHSKENLQTSLAKIENACDLAKNLSQMGTDLDITSMYPTLSANLEELTKTKKPDAVDESMGCFGVQEVGEMEVPDVVCLVGGERWMMAGKIKTTEGYLYGIAVHPNGNVAITTGFIKTAHIYSRNGDLKYTFKGPFDADIDDFAITPDNRYILPGKAELFFYDDQGNRLKYPKASTYNANNKPANPKTLAVDSRGRIIVGLCNSTTISIHHADGQLISKFTAPAIPQRLAVTSQGDIAATFRDYTLQLMDYSGNNVRVVQPPPGVSKWVPRAICCSKRGEIFVVNDGSPQAVHRYTADGDECLGCVITGLDIPYGIAITEDGQQLYVTEFCQHVVKIFQRPWSTNPFLDLPLSATKHITTQVPFNAEIMGKLIVTTVYDVSSQDFLGNAIT